VRVGIGAGVAALAFLLVGADRAFDLDDSITVGLFVRTPSIADAFTTAYVLNNQVLFSFLEHLVHTLTGTHSEAAMRLLPTVLAAAAVGVLGGTVATRWGVLCGCTAAAVLATNPMFADVGTQVRGYGLVTLAVVVTSALLLRSIETGTASTPARVAYAALGAIGVATHLYMVVVLCIHVVLAGANRRVAPRWVAPWLASLVGLAAYARVWRPMRETADALGRSFRAPFPRDLGVALLGGSVVATALLLVLVVPVVWRARHLTVVRLGGAAVAVAVVGVWVIGPYDLYPRFFVWLAPLVALGAAAAVLHDRRWTVVVVAVVALQVATVWPRLTTDPVASGRVAEVFARVRRAGGTPCVVDDFTRLRLIGYTRDFAVVGSADQLPACDVVASLDRSHGPGPARDADRAFPHRRVLRARNNGLLWSRLPASCWLTSSRGC
jgi:hypothetical protein